MERRFAFEYDNLYHIYNRGVEKRVIFQDEDDKRRFQKMLYLANGDKPVVYARLKGEPFEKSRGDVRTSLTAYSLMSNHFHIIAREIQPGGISAFMGKLSTSYSMYFNTKNQRSGPLLCHPFRAKHVEHDDYLRWLISYVHLNPLDLIEPNWKEKGIVDVARAKQFLTTYPFSSYVDYFGAPRIENKIVDKDLLPFDAAGLESFDDMLKEFKDRPDQTSADGW